MITGWGKLMSAHRYKREISDLVYPCNGVEPYGAQIAEIQAFVDHKIKCKTNASTILAYHVAFFFSFFFLNLHARHMHLTNHKITGNPKYP